MQLLAWMDHSLRGPLSKPAACAWRGRVDLAACSVHACFNVRHRNLEAVNPQRCMAMSLARPRPTCGTTRPTTSTGCTLATSRQVHPLTLSCLLMGSNACSASRLVKHRTVSGTGSRKLQQALMHAMPADGLLCMQCIMPSKPKKRSHQAQAAGAPAGADACHAC